VLKEIPPFPPLFPDQLASYYEQAAAAAKKHHDTRRRLFLNFLHESFNVDPAEVELERKIKADELGGNRGHFVSSSSCKVSKTSLCFLYDVWPI
jgi:hypothetical protein